MKFLVIIIFCLLALSYQRRSHSNSKLSRSLTSITIKQKDVILFADAGSSGSKFSIYVEGKKVTKDKADTIGGSDKENGRLGTFYKKMVDKGTKDVATYAAEYAKACLGILTDFSKVDTKTNKVAKEGWDNLPKVTKIIIQSTAGSRVHISNLQKLDPSANIKDLTKVVEAELFKQLKPTLTALAAQTDVTIKILSGSFEGVFAFIDLCTNSGFKDVQVVDDELPTKRYFGDQDPKEVVYLEIGGASAQIVGAVSVSKARRFSQSRNQWQSQGDVNMELKFTKKDGKIETRTIKLFSISLLGGGQDLLRDQVLFNSLPDKEKTDEAKKQLQNMNFIDTYSKDVATCKGKSKCYQGPTDDKIKDTKDEYILLNSCHGADTDQTKRFAECKTEITNALNTADTWAPEEKAKSWTLLDSLKKAKTSLLIDTTRKMLAVSAKFEVIDATVAGKTPYAYAKFIETANTKCKNIDWTALKGECGDSKTESLYTYGKLPKQCRDFRIRPCFIYSLIDSYIGILGFKTDNLQVFPMEADWTSGSIRTELQKYKIEAQAEEYNAKTPNTNENVAAKVTKRRLRMNKRHHKNQHIL